VRGWYLRRCLVACLVTWAGMKEMWALDIFWAWRASTEETDSAGRSFGLERQPSRRGLESLLPRGNGEVYGRGSPDIYSDGCRTWCLAVRPEHAAQAETLARRST
jgi:hypothetical protein